MSGADAHPIPDPNNSPKQVFRRRQRLILAKDYAAAYNARAKKIFGPLIVFSRPNGLAHSRLGLSVGRRVGNAVVRNRVKRLIREAFRLEQFTLPPGYDMIVSVRAHEPGGLDQYRRTLVDAAAALHQEWDRRRRRSETGSPAPGGPPSAEH